MFPLLMPLSWPERADALSVEPPMAILAAAKPMAMLRIMMLILHYSTSEHPSRSLIKLSGFPLQRCGIVAPGGLPMNAG
jgi:hypothetical protein